MEEGKEDTKDDVATEEPKPTGEAMDVDSEAKHPLPSATEAASGDSTSGPKVEPKDEGEIPESDDQPKVEEEAVEESKDWLKLPMLEKLDSLHLLTDWQFQNPHRVRQLMKDDDDAANWVSVTARPTGLQRSLLIVTSSYSASSQSVTTRRRMPTG